MFNQGTRPLDGDRLQKRGTTDYRSVDATCKSASVNHSSACRRRARSKITNNRGSDGDERATAGTGDVCTFVSTTFARVLRVVQAVKTLEVRYLSCASRIFKKATQKEYRIIITYVYVYICIYYVNISCILVYIFQDFLAGAFEWAWKAR